jgi:hypothetical protein
MNREPMSEWFLREEILAAFHRWPVIVAFVLVGSLIGIAFTFIWPSSFRASTEISVELNPYRALDDKYVAAFANAEFRNIDDYKHWQMSQLSMLVSSDDYVGETLNRLKRGDSYWQSVEIQQLREMLEVKWRNAGRWLLTAEAGSPEQAENALETWRDVILEKTNYAISRSQELFRIELAIRGLNEERAALESRRDLLQEIDKNLEVALQESRKIPPNEPFGQTERKQLFHEITQAADGNPSWQKLVDDFPADGAQTSQYITWIELARENIHQEMDAIRVTNRDLDERISAKTMEWESTLHEGQGLSATLFLEELNTEPIDAIRARSTSLAALVGAILGLLAWMFLTLFQITRTGYS